MSGQEAEQPTVPAPWPGKAAAQSQPVPFPSPTQPAQPLQSTILPQDQYSQSPSWNASAGQRMGQDGRGPQNYPPGPAMVAGTFRSQGDVRKKSPARRRGRGLRVLLSLVLLLVILAGAWFALVRPYLHNIAQTQVDRVLSNAVQQINPSLLPPGSATVPLTQNTMNNLIVLNTAPSDPVQNMHAQISPSDIQIDFTAYGFACTVTMTPVVQNGLLQVSNVSVQGILGLIMSPDELTATLDSHLKDASARLHRTITGVVLKNQEMDVSLT